MSSGIIRLEPGHCKKSDSAVGYRPQTIGWRADAPTVAAAGSAAERQHTFGSSWPGRGPQLQVTAPIPVVRDLDAGSLSESPRRAALQRHPQRLAYQDEVWAGDAPPGGAHPVVPVAYVLVPGGASAKTLTAQFARYLGIPTTTRMTQAQLMQAVHPHLQRGRGPAGADRRDPPPQPPHNHRRGSRRPAERPDRTDRRHLRLRRYRRHHHAPVHRGAWRAARRPCLTDRDRLPYPPALVPAAPSPASSRTSRTRPRPPTAPPRHPAPPRGLSPPAHRRTIGSLTA